MVKDPLDKVTEEMPEPQDHVIEKEAADAEAEAVSAAPGSAVPGAYSHARDVHGRSFDPKIHETNAEGAPVFRKNGMLRLKRGHGSEVHRERTGQSEVRTAAEVRAEPSPAKAGGAIAESIFALGQALGGEEWTPAVNHQYGIDERAQMHDAWSRYCESKGLDDVPPGLAVLIACFAYAGPRFAMPKTKSRLQKAKEWAVGKWVGWKLRKSGGDTRSDRGNDGKRKDHAGQGVSSEVRGEGDAKPSPRPA